MLLLLGFGAVICMPSFIPPREIRAPNACVCNLKHIEEAKKEWAREHGKSRPDPVDEEEVNRYIKGGRPECPADGTYTYGRVGEKPRCSVEAHTRDYLERSRSGWR